MGKILINIVDGMDIVDLPFIMATLVSVTGSVSNPPSWTAEEIKVTEEPKNPSTPITIKQQL